ncbi:MAG: hypothetical protein ABI588_06485, partial [Arenimonas sp.]
KRVHDTFAMPLNEFPRVAELKARARRLGRHAKKSEIVRAGIAALQCMTDAQFAIALDSLPRSIARKK